MNTINNTPKKGNDTDRAKRASIEQGDQRFMSHAEHVLAAHDRKAAALDVGDPDSFGRPVRWLGVVGTKTLDISTECTPPPEGEPEELCLQIDPDTHSASGEYRDIGTITLPAGSTHSQICHWLSPTMNGFFANDTGLDNRNARLTLFPTVTFENAALNAPGLVDPNSGLPLAGKVEAGVPAISIDMVLDDGERTNARNTSTRTCTGGLMSKSTLMDYYGLSSRQVRDFQNNPTTIRLNMRVMASYVEQGYVGYVVRFVGD